ncbi:hypothetical protein PMG11_07186 [Penicillium brasilianum]|uniref:C2H2-type domain-containing protein n=1 Tax=Penicillium brasilianum TaxID=104259 RepID=A0A0F7TU04_PENBI|nr:hypothetical protein PMG11_07186 [Penicillium brasilianum]
MSINCSLLQFPNDPTAYVPSYLSSPPPPTQHLPRALPSSTFTENCQILESKCTNRRSVGSSPPSSSCTDSRVSKAKKGKRVHACEYPGCTKIFTRAEHRRRHELSHKNKKSHSCTYIGCHKSFHRADYLAQHMARHGGEPISPKTKHALLIKTEPAPYSLSGPSLSRTYPAKSPITNNVLSIESCGNGIYRSTAQSSMRCSQCFGCGNNLQCHGQGPHINNYSNTVNYSPIFAVPSPSGLCETHDPNTPFSSAGSDSVIENYTGSILRPEAFITPLQTMSPPPQTEESMNASFWDANIDPNLAPMSPAIFNNDTPYPT